MVYAQHFTQEEFRDWAEDMIPRLVTMLDTPLVGAKCQSTTLMSGAKLGQL